MKDAVAAAAADDEPGTEDRDLDRAIRLGLRPGGENGCRGDQRGRRSDELAPRVVDFHHWILIADCPHERAERAGPTRC